MSSIKPFFKCFYVKKTDGAEAGGDECLRGVWTHVSGGRTQEGKGSQGPLCRVLPRGSGSIPLA